MYRDCDALHKIALYITSLFTINRHLYSRSLQWHHRKPVFLLIGLLFSKLLLHIAFRAQSRTKVDEFYKAAIAAGGQCNGKPGLREIYHPNYYGAFVIDPDGHNIEAVCHTEA